MHKVLRILTPRSRKDALWKCVVFTALLTLWNLVFTWRIQGHTQIDLTELMFSSIVVGGPFAALFVFTSWQQFAELRETRRQARLDALSGVLNRQTFIEQLNHAVLRARRGLLLLIDADHFKSVNDRFGHATGDRCISAIGHRLSWHLREEDIVGRIGGEEFAVFLPDVTVEHGRMVAERLGQPVSCSDAGRVEHLTVTLSIGAVWTTPESDCDAQLAQADDALYQAKTAGRARMIFADDGQEILLGRVVNYAAPSGRPSDRRTSQHTSAA